MSALEGTEVFVDGELVAKGEGTQPVPPQAAGPVFGSARTGQASAEGDVEEICVLGGPLSQAAVAFHYGVYERQAVLGPISETEWQARREALAKQKAEREAALAAAAESDPQTLLLVGGTSACLTNVPVHLTNMVCAFDTSLGWTVTFDSVFGRLAPAWRRGGANVNRPFCDRCGRSGRWGWNRLSNWLQFLDRRQFCKLVW